MLSFYNKNFVIADSIFIGNNPSISQLQFESQDKGGISQIHIEKNNTLLIYSNNMNGREWVWEGSLISHIHVFK